MAHQMAPSVNCSLDEIDLNALKVLIRNDNIFIKLIIIFSPRLVLLFLMVSQFGLFEFNSGGGEANADKN